MDKYERLELLKQIEKDIHVCSLESTFEDDAKSCALHSAIEELEQRWIPVSERLPEEQKTIGKYIFSENVLGTEGYTIRRAYYNYTTKEWFDGNEEMEWTEITHWMPLPEEPYKVESESDVQ